MGAERVRMEVVRARLSRKLRWTQRGRLSVVLKAPDIIFESRKVSHSLSPSWNQCFEDQGIISEMEVAVVSAGLLGKVIVGKGTADFTFLAHKGTLSLCIPLEWGESICGDLWLKADLITEKSATRL